MYDRETIKGIIKSLDLVFGDIGTIVLREILVPLLKSGRNVAFVSLLSIIGISLLFGDGVITPAISILSAVEGMALIPGLEGISQETLVIIAAMIAIALFAIKKSEYLAEALSPLNLDVFLEEHTKIYNNLNKISGTALFFARDIKRLPPYIVNTMFFNNIIAIDYNG